MVNLLVGSWERDLCLVEEEVGKRAQSEEVVESAIQAVAQLGSHAKAMRGVAFDSQNRMVAIISRVHQIRDAVVAADEEPGSQLASLRRKVDTLVNNIGFLQSYLTSEEERANLAVCIASLKVLLRKENWHEEVAAQQDFVTHIERLERFLACTVFEQLPPTSIELNLLIDCRDHYQGSRIFLPQKVIEAGLRLSSLVTQFLSLAPERELEGRLGAKEDLAELIKGQEKWEVVSVVVPTEGGRGLRYEVYHAFRLDSRLQWDDRGENIEGVWFAAEPIVLEYDKELRCVSVCHQEELSSSFPTFREALTFVEQRFSDISVLRRWVDLMDTPFASPGGAVMENQRLVFRFEEGGRAFHGQLSLEGRPDLGKEFDVKLGNEGILFQQVGASREVFGSLEPLLIRVDELSAELALAPVVEEKLRIEEELCRQYEGRIKFEWNRHRLQVVVGQTVVTERIVIEPQKQAASTFGLMVWLGDQNCLIERLDPMLSEKVSALEERSDGLNQLLTGIGQMLSAPPTEGDCRLLEHSFLKVLDLSGPNIFPVADHLHTLLLSYILRSRVLGRAAVFRAQPVVKQFLGASQRGELQMDIYSLWQQSVDPMLEEKEFGTAFAWMGMFFGFVGSVEKEVMVDRLMSRRALFLESREQADKFLRFFDALAGAQQDARLTHLRTLSEVAREGGIPGFVRRFLRPYYSGAISSSRELRSPRVPLERVLVEAWKLAPPSLGELDLESVRNAYISVAAKYYGIRSSSGAVTQQEYLYKRYTLTSGEEVTIGLLEPRGWNFNRIGRAELLDRIVREIVGALEPALSYDFTSLPLLSRSLLFREVRRQLIIRMESEGR